MIQDAIRKVIERIDLSANEARAVMNELMSGECTDAQIGAFITALRMKTESVEEVAACAAVMREKAQPIAAPEGVIDTCGTGGDASGTFNISTASAIVAAAGGAVVAKHGNRSVSSNSGSADVLKTLGVNIEADVTTVERCIAEVGIGFLFAPLLHGAMKHVIGPRREIGIRTVFNILGPLSNPAGAKRQVLGVYDPVLATTLAMVLRDLGSECALVVHGRDGLDEISLAGPTLIAELKNGRVDDYEVTPADFGMNATPLDAIRVDGPEESAAMIREALGGKAGPAADVIALNAGAALYVADIAPNFEAGVAHAQTLLANGAAQATLEQLAACSNN